MKQLRPFICVLYLITFSLDVSEPSYAKPTSSESTGNTADAKLDTTDGGEEASEDNADTTAEEDTEIDIKPLLIQPIQPGAVAPDFILFDATTQTQFHLYQMLQQGPVLLNVIQGTWDQKLTLQLSFYNRHQKFLAYDNIQVVFLCMDTPYTIRKFLKSHDEDSDNQHNKKITFHFLSDIHGRTLAKYQAVRRISKSEKKRFKRQDNSLKDLLGHEPSIIPSPRIYAIAQDRRIVFSGLTKDVPLRTNLKKIIKKMKQYSETSF